MNKKIVSLLLVLSLVLGSFSMVFAAPSDVVGTDYEEDVAKLMAIGVLAGYPDGTFKPENTVTRAEFAKMIVVASGLEDAAVLSAGATQFPDVAADHWAAGYINVATQKKFIEGYPNGNYGPEDKITYAQMFTILIRAIGLGDVVEKDGVWPSNYLAKAVQLELNDGLASAANDAATRGDVAIAFVNTMTETMWGATGVNSDGTVDYTLIPGQTMLTELGYSTTVKAAVDGSQQFGGLKATEVKTTTATYDLADSCMQDPDAFYGQEVTLWLDDDGDVVYIENETDEDDIIVDEIDDIVAGILTLDNDEEYDIVTGLIAGYYNMSAVAVLPAAPTDDVAIKLVLDGNGDVAYYAAWSEAEATYGVVVVDTDVVETVGDEIEFYNGDIADIDIEDWNDDMDDDDIRVEVVRNGEVASLEDIEVGDVVTVYDDNVVANPYFKLVVTDDKVSGTLTKVQGDKLYIGTTSYSVDGDVLATLDSGDNIIAWVGNEADFVGETVELSFNGVGEIAYINSDVDVLAENYAIVTDVLSGAGPTWSVVSGVSEAYIEVLNSDDETVILSFENDTNSVDAYAAAASEFAAGNGFIKYEINDDGYVEKVYSGSNATVATNYTDDLLLADDYEKIVGAAGVIYEDPDYVNGTDNYFVNSDSVIFVVDSTATNDAKVYDNWEDVVNAGVPSTNVEVKFDSDNLVEYVVVDTKVSTDTMYGLYVEDGINADGDTVVIYESGSESTYENQTVDLAALAKGDLVMYKVTDDEFVEDTALATVNINGAGAAADADGLLVVAGAVADAAGSYGSQVNAVVSVNADNALLTINIGGANTTFSMEDDVVIYNIDDVDNMEMVTLDDVNDDYFAVVIDTDNDGEIDVVVIDK